MGARGRNADSAFPVYSKRAAAKLHPAKLYIKGDENHPAVFRQVAQADDAQAGNPGRFPPQGDRCAEFKRSDRPRQS
jgi:hypothetical protein